MSILKRIRGWLSMILSSKVKDEFQIEPIQSPDMDSMIAKCINIYKGKPYWLDDDIKTIKFAKAVCSETARLVTIGTKIIIDGSARAEWLQNEIDKVYFNIRDWVEYGCAYGTIILKPNGKSVDMITPENFIVTDCNSGDITGIVFINKSVSTDGKKFYTRLEYHRYINDAYVITNKCYVSASNTDLGKSINIQDTPWKNLSEEIYGHNVKNPLYGVLKMPHANDVDIDSPLGLPIFSDAIEELKDLDIAYSRNATEIYDSKRTVLLDSDKLLVSGSKVTPENVNSLKNRLGLPDFVKNVFGNGTEDFYQEINPTLNTDTRIVGINALLSQIGYKIGYSNGYFVFNESTGIQTATGVEAEQQRTVQFVKDVRDKLENCLDGLIYALNVFADYYGYAPLGNYEITYDFGDILYNREDDKVRWWNYVVSGNVPAWKYFEKFEGMSEEEAKAMVAEAQPKQPTLFGEE